MESHLHLQSLIGYFSEHSAIALVAVFLASFLESVALIGTIVPGSTIAFAGGMLVGLKALDPWAAATAAVGGAVLGDGISYWLGHRYRDSIRMLWPIRQHPEIIARGEAYFTRHGGKSVFFGRFLGPVRAIVPVIAGMTNMRASHFFVMNVLSAFGWAAVHLVPGALFGASLQLAGAVSARLVVLIGVVAAAIWLIAFVVRIAVKVAWPYVRLLQDRIVVHAQRRPGWLAKLVLPLVDPARPDSMSLLIAATMLIGGAWLFLGVVEDVVTKDSLVQADRAVYEFLQSTRTGWIDDIMVTITALGSAYVTIAVIAAVALWLAMSATGERSATGSAPSRLPKCSCGRSSTGSSASGPKPITRASIRTRFQAVTRRCRSSCTDFSRSCLPMGSHAGRRSRSRCRPYRSPC